MDFIVIELVERPDGPVAAWLDVSRGVHGGGSDFAELSDLVRGRYVVTWRADQLAALASDVLNGHAGIVDVRSELQLMTDGRIRARERHEIGGAFTDLSTEAPAPSLGDGGARSGDAALRDAHHRTAWLGTVLRRMVESGFTPTKNGNLRGAYSFLIGRGAVLGYPVDTELLDKVRTRAGHVVARASRLLDLPAGVFANGELVPGAAASWALGRGIQWPRSPDGHPLGDLSRIAEVGATDPVVLELVALARWTRLLRAGRLASPVNGRLRHGVVPMAALTGRDILDTDSDIFTWPSAMRRVLRPADGSALVHFDVRGLDVGVAAGLSNDPLLRTAMGHEDPYAALASAVGATSMPRAAFKRALLAHMYGVGTSSLAQVTHIEPDAADGLLRRLRLKLHRFQAWREDTIVHGRNGGVVTTALGWRYRPIASDRNARIANVPVQGTGADLVRLVAVELAMQGLAVLGTVHDAVVMEVSEGEVGDAIFAADTILARASERLLQGLRLRGASTIVTSASPWPTDALHEKFWRAVDWEPAPLLRPRGGY